MIGKALHIVSAVALVAATAVIAAPPAGNAQTDANKQICRTMTDTGSRLGHSRACHTAREWQELRRQTKQTVDHIQNVRPDSCPPFC